MLANEDKVRANQRSMQTAQGQASDMTYGQNGITAENGYVHDINGKISYVGK